MSTRSRVAALVFACVALVGASTTTASADEVDDLYAGANAVTATLSVLGTDLGSFAGTSAVAEKIPLVEVASFGFQGPDGALGIGLTKAVADTLGAIVSDPGDAGQACGVPDLAALPVADLLDVLGVCSSSQASLPDLLAPQALGAADAGGIAVNGQAIADVVFDVLLDPILAQLDGLVVQVQGALAPVESALAAVCDELPRELSPAGLAEQANRAGLPITDIIRSLPEGEQILELLEADCLLSLDTLVDVVAAVPDIAESLVRDTLLAALDQDLLAITLGSSASSISPVDGALAASSQLQALDISTLSLQFLLDAVEDLVAVQVQGVLDQVLSAVPAELGAVTSQLPALGDVVGPVLAQLDGLVDDAPLLRVTVADSLADARAVPGSDAVDTSRSTAGGVTVEISPAIAGLLGIPAQITVPTGQRQVIAQGTPLESVISVGTVEQITETLGASQVQTAGARVTGTEIALLTGLQGGIVAGTGVTEARVGGTTVAAPATPGTPETSLPRTGSTDDATLLAGMGALALLGAALHLRRRSDA